VLVQVVLEVLVREAEEEARIVVVEQALLQAQVVQAVTAK
jgi:hypothetical protein